MKQDEAHEPECPHVPGIIIVMRRERKCEVLSVKCRAWSKKCGVWSVKCGVSSMGCRV